MSSKTDVLKFLERFLGENDQEWDIKNFIQLETDETKIRIAMALKQTGMENFLLIGELYEPISPKLADFCFSIVKQDHKALKQLIKHSKNTEWDELNGFSSKSFALPAWESGTHKGGQEVPTMILQKCLNFKKSCRKAFESMESSCLDPSLKKVFSRRAMEETIQIKALSSFLENVKELLAAPNLKDTSQKNLKGSLT